VGSAVAEFPIIGEQGAGRHPRAARQWSRPGGWVGGGDGVRHRPATKGRWSTVLASPGSRYRNWVVWSGGSCWPRLEAGFGQRDWS
jgi:hypothetical protein